MPANKMIELFQLNTSSGIPIYRQLVDQIKQAINLGLLVEEQQLPSVRLLAKSLQINPMTISKAYAQLELEKFLVRKRGVGMMIAPQRSHIEIPSSVSSSLQVFIDSARASELTDESIMLLVQQGLSVNLGGKNS